MKKFISYLLVMVMIMTIVPANVFNTYASEYETHTEADYTENEENKEDTENSEEVKSEDADAAEKTSKETETVTEAEATTAHEATDVSEETTTEQVSEADTENEKETESTQQGSEEDNTAQQTFSIDYKAVNANKTGAEAEGILTYASDIQDGYSDYTPYMDSHTITVDGKEIKSGDIINPTESFKLDLAFTLDISDMAKDGLLYYFELPEHISIGNQGSAANPLTLYNSKHVAIGTYYILEDVIYVEFPGYYDEVKTTFSLSASWDDTENKLSIEVPWSDRVDMYNINPCELLITKNSTGYVSDKDGNLVNKYTIKVMPKNEGLSVKDITFKDVFTVLNLAVYENYFDGDKEYKLTYYTGDKNVSKVEYYDYNDVATRKDSKINVQIDGIDIEDGGYFTVEYAAIIPLDKRQQIDANNGADNYINTARASYMLDNPDTGEKQELFVETRINGRYKAESEWIFKQAEDETKTINLNGGQKTVVPYTLNVNKRRAYSLGGSCIHDEITNFVDGDVVYYTGRGSHPYIEARDSKGSRKIDQKWIILGDDLYAQFCNLTAASDSDTALERFRKSNLKSQVLAAINSAEGTAYTEFTDEVAAKYIFTDAASHNFVWLMPLDSEPTSYLVYYETIADVTVGSFKNGASLWYTEMEGYPKGPGAGWTKPVKKVLNATKTNEGVYVGDDGNYYVDYTITVGLEAGSAAFDDVIVKDYFPKYNNVPIGEGKYKVTDWLVGLEPDSLPQSLDGEEEVEVISRCFDISTDSSNPAVQAVVDRAHTCAVMNRARLSVYTKYYNYDAFYSNILYNGWNVYSGEAIDAGQIVLTDSGKNYKKGNTACVEGVCIYLGPLPATEEGYDINIKYTMQVNPCLVDALPELLDDKDYITMSNTADVYTTEYVDDGDPWMTAFIRSMNSSYWIGINNTVPGIAKDITSYKEDKGTLGYKVTINPNENIMGNTSTYDITDKLGVSGLKYKKNSFTLYDSNNNVIWSNVSGRSPATKYKDSSKYIKFTFTESDNTSNEFKLSLDNSTSLFNGSDGKLLKMTLEYDADVSTYPTDIKIMNNAGLIEQGYDEKNDRFYQNGLGEAVSEYAIDKAIEKKLSQKPTEENGYNAGYYIDINPKSDNAKQLGKLKKGDTFTVRDTMCDKLLLDIDNVSVLQYVNGVSSNITDKCQLKYNSNTGIFDTVITITNENATYRINYNAFVSAGAGEYVVLRNSAVILGTDVREDTSVEKVLIYAYDDSASAYAKKINLIKYDTDNFDKRLNATFDLYKYSDKQWVCITDEQYGYGQITTDAQGRVTIENKVVNQAPVLMVEEGCWYKLVEVEAQNGYIADKTPIYYYVSTDGQVESSGRPSDAVKAGYEVIILAEAGAADDDIPILYAENEIFGFDINKVNLGTRELIAGAEFTLYGDAACTEVIAALADEDADGILSFRNLKVADTIDGKLYLKETKTPKGYVGKDETFTITLENGYISGITGDKGSVVSIDNSGSMSVITVPNEKATGYLKLTKDVTGDKEKQFTFSIKLTDEDGAVLSDAYPAVITRATGDTEKINYKSGSVIYLANKDNIVISDLPENTKYSVKEVADNDYSTAYSIEDSFKTDNIYKRSGYTAQGTIEAGGMDSVTFHNTGLGRMIISKTMKDEEGEELTIHDGFTISVYRESTLICKAVWKQSLQKYVAEYLAAEVSFSNDLENKFELSRLSKATYYVRESNADKEGYAYELTYDNYFYREGKISINGYTASGTKVNMINTYTDNYVEQQIVANKVLKNKELKRNQFTFNLYETDASGNMGNNKTPLFTAENDSTGRVAFEKIRYTKAGTYNYIIKEVIPTDAKNQGNNKYLYNGMMYDAAPIYVKTEVTEDENGKLSIAEPVYSSELGGAEISPVITNEYNAEGSVTFTGKKTLKNKILTNKQFGFTITQMTDSKYSVVKTDDNGNAVTYTGYNKSAASNKPADIVFDEITYDEADIDKTYYYVVTENIPDDADGNMKNGILYDDTSYRVSVKITDNGDGTLNAVPTYEDGDISFENEYNASGSITFKGRKRLFYKNIEDGQFEFVITEYTSSAATRIKKDAAGNNIVYTGTVNTAQIADGKAYAEADIVFPEIEYGIKDVGPHYYKVTEKIPTDAVNNKKNGIKYDSRQYSIMVNVTDNGDGTLKTTASASAYDMLFSNTYEASATLQFEGSKVLNGRNMADGEFWFSANAVKVKNGVTEPYGQGYIGYSLSDGQIYFMPLSFTAADIGWTYLFNIYESVPAGDTQGYLPGVTYSDEAYIAEIKITDAGNGKLNTEVKYYDTENVAVSGIQFINEYDAEGTITFEATKLLNGRTLLDGQFEFAMYEGDKVVATGTNDATGKISFTPIRFYIDGSRDGVESYIGTHDYVVKEVIPENPASGYTYDDTEYSIKVKATDNGNGTIDVKVQEGASISAAGITYQVTVPEGNDANFENSYGAKGTFVFEGTKILNGRTLDDGEFTFTATEYRYVGDVRTATGRTFIGSNDTEGNITFEDIEYTINSNQNDLGLWEYEISENIPADEDMAGGVTYDTENKYTVSLYVTDNGDGTLAVTPQVGYEPVTFENTYEAEGEFKVDVTKYAKLVSGEEYHDVNDENTDMENTFTVEMYEVISNKTQTDDVQKDDPQSGDAQTDDVQSGDAAEEILVGSVDVKVDETANIHSFKYTLADVGSHRYVIREKQTEAAGYTTDETEYYINVTVADKRDGTLSVIATDDEGNSLGEEVSEALHYEVSFTNIYETSGSYVPTGTKRINNIDLMESAYNMPGEAFSFTMKEYTSFAAIEKNEAGETVSTGVSKADGSIEFTEITYDMSDVGEHYYLITEDDDKTLDCVINTTVPVYVTVTVTNNGDGTLAADIEYTRLDEVCEEALFINEATSVEINKENEDGELIAGAVLEIIDENGDVVCTFTSSSKNGRKVYGLDKNKTYTLHEKSAPKGYQLADDISFYIDDEGLLIIDGTESEAVTMVDKKQPEEPDKPETPDKPTTGDNTNIPFAVGCMLISAAFILCMLKRKKELHGRI